MNEKSKLIRVHRNFYDEIEEIRNERANTNMPKLSYTKITSLILRHKQWARMKNDIIKFVGDEYEQ